MENKNIDMLFIVVIAIVFLGAVASILQKQYIISVISGSLLIILVFRTLAKLKKKAK